MPAPAPRLTRRTLIGGAAASAGTLSFPAILRASDTVKLGFLGPLSGALAFVGQTNQNCLTLAVEEINASGGIGGRKVEVVTEDSQMSTKTTVDKARKLIASDRVEAITGCVLPSEREAILSIAAPAQKMVLYPNFDEGRCHPNLLTTGNAYNQSVVPVAGWLAKNVGKTAYALVSDIGTNRQFFIPMLKAALEAHGGELAGVQFFPFGTRDFGPALQQVKAANPAMVWHAIGDDPITFVKQYKSFEMKPQLVTALAHESIAVATEGAAVGALSTESYFMSIDTPENHKLLDTYTARYSDFARRFVRGKAVVLPHGERTYVAVKVWAEAARAANSTEIGKVRDAFAGLEIAAPRGPVRVETGTGHLLCESLLGRVQPDNSIETVARLGVLPAQCVSI